MRIMVIIIAIGAGIIGCASTPLSQSGHKTDSNIVLSKQDSLLLAVDGTDYAADWLGQYEGTGDVFAEELKKWQEGSLMRLNIRYGKSTPDGRITLVVEGGSGLSIRGSTRFFLQGIEVDNIKEISGVYVHSNIPSPPKFEYSFSKREWRIIGHVKGYRGESKYGPFFPADEWKFEVEKVEMKQ